MKKSSIYSDKNQVLSQRDVDQGVDEYFDVTYRLGSVRMVVNEKGEAVENITYDPFGNVLEAQLDGDLGNIFRFAGYFWDAVLGQYRLGARDFDPELSRFAIFALVLIKAASMVSALEEQTSRRGLLVVSAFPFAAISIGRPKGTHSTNHSR